jgi:hypothetical protein
MKQTENTITLSSTALDAIRKSEYERGKKESMEKMVLLVPTASEIADISHRTVKRYIKKGMYEPYATKIGNKWMIKLQDLLRVHGQ